jgi:hypothetical protein
LKEKKKRGIELGEGVFIVLGVLAHQQYYKAGIIGPEGQLKGRRGKKPVKVSRESHFVVILW